MELFTAIVCFIALTLASFTDLKTREVPDFLSYSFIATGVFYNALLTVLNWNYSYVIASLLGLIAMLLVSLLLFYTGQWGGGDAKLIMGVGAWLGIPFFAHKESLLLGLYLLNCLLMGGLYGLGWTLMQAVKYKRDFTSSFIARLREKRLLQIVLLLLAVFVLILTFFLQNRMLCISILALVLLLLTTLYLWIFIQVVEEKCFYKRMRPSELTEGDWLVEPVVVRGRQVVKPNPAGLALKEITKLQELEKSKLVAWVTIKEGIPFVPVLLLGFIILLLNPHWLLLLLR